MRWAPAGSCHPGPMAETSEAATGEATPGSLAGIIYGVLAVATVVAAEGTRRESYGALVDEAAILAGALLPVLALAISWGAGATVESGVTASLWSAGVELGVLELVASLRRRLSVRDTVVETAIGV